MYYKDYVLFWTSVDETKPPRDKPLFVWVQFNENLDDQHATGFPTVATLSTRFQGWLFDDSDLSPETVTVTHWKPSNTPKREAEMARNLSKVVGYGTEGLLKDTGKLVARSIEQILLNGYPLSRYPGRRVVKWTHEMPPRARKSILTHVDAYRKTAHKVDQDTIETEDTVAYPDPEGKFNPANPKCKACKGKPFCEWLNRTMDELEAEADDLEDNEG